MRTVITAGLMALTAILASAELEAETIRTEDLLDQMQDSFRNVADEVFSSLVHVEAYSGESGSSGSGFIVDHDSENSIFYVATNHHVAGGQYDDIRVTTRDGRSFEAVLCCVTFLQSGRPKVLGYLGKESSVEHHVVDEVWRLGQPRYMARRRFSS